MSGALQGIRVIDMATPRGELAGRILADLGAEVIKVEPPAGCASRRLPPFSDADPSESLYWAALGLGKRSVVLDTGDPEGLRSLLELVRTADVFIESSTPGELEAQGLGYAALSELNPGLVYLSITPFGQVGPDAYSPATDLTVEAAAGLLGLIGDGDRPPVPIGYPQAGFHGGAVGALDALVALNERQRSGRGQHLDTSMQAAVIWTLLTATAYPTYTGDDPPRTGARRTNPPPEFAPEFTMPRSGPCADGWLVFVLVFGPAGVRTLSDLMAWATEEDLLPDQLREINWATWGVDVQSGTLDATYAQATVDTVLTLFRRKTKREVMDRAVAGKLLVAPVYTVSDLLSDPQLASRDFWVEMAGRVYPGPFAKLSGTPITYSRPAPTLGADQALLSNLAVPDVSGAPPAPKQRRPAFDGLRVADFAWVGAGPLISKVLADHGATVIHLESATRLDYLRLLPPFRGGTPGINANHTGPNFNTSKLGLAANLGMPEGLSLARRLAAWADVIVESFTPGVMDRLGLGYAALSATRPELIMISSTMRGQTGPEAEYAGFGNQGGALAGFEAITGWPDRGPCGIWGAYTDFVSPRYAAAALFAAILHRERTGRGQYIDLSQAESSIHFIEPLILDYTVNSRIRGPQGHASWYAAPHGVYRTSGDERYIAIATETTEQWGALVRAACLTGFDGTESADLRRERAGEISDGIASWCATRDAFAAADLLKAAGVPAAAVQRPSDLHLDPTLQARGFFVTLNHAEQGPTVFDGLATRFGSSPAGPFRAGPCIGEHNALVLEEHLKLSPAEIEQLAASGVLQ